MKLDKVFSIHRKAHVFRSLTVDQLLILSGAEKLGWISPKAVTSVLGNRFSSRYNSLVLYRLAKSGYLSREDREKKKYTITEKGQLALWYARHI